MPNILGDWLLCILRVQQLSAEPPLMMMTVQPTCLVRVTSWKMTQEYLEFHGVHPGTVHHLGYGELCWHRGSFLVCTVQAAAVPGARSDAEQALGFVYLCICFHRLRLKVEKDG